MKLGFLNARTNHYQELRSLTLDELTAHDGFLAPVTEARNRLMLFRLLDNNFKEWRNYLNSLLSVAKGEPTMAMEELNRHLLNYLTTAYTIQEHFRVTFVKRFRKEKSKIEEHEEFVRKLSDKHWEFGFVLDYRHFVQHRGLAVGRYRRSPSETSITLSITTDAAELVAGGREKDWKLSKLTADKGVIDLVHAIRTFHILMGQEYGMFVANTFFPDLVKADDFYRPLTLEAKKLDPEATMIFYKKDVERTTMPDGTISYDISYVVPPNDVFSELGLVVKR